MLAADGCASSSSYPACCFCGVWAPRRAEGVAVATFGLSLVWACSSADVSALRMRIYIAMADMLIRGLGGECHISLAASRTLAYH
jgi:hypothetical protein